MSMTALVLAAYLSATPTPAKVVWDPDRLSEKYIELPPLKGSDEKDAETFTIHVRTQHTPTHGTTVRVQLGSLEMVEKCRQSEAACFGSEPLKSIVQRLFDDALNYVLRNNERGLGRYSIEKCEKLEKPHGWLKLLTKVMVELDPDLVYKIEKKEGAFLLDYAMRVWGFDRAMYGYAKFGPPAGQNRAHAIEYVWKLCGDEKTRSSIDIVTQVDTRQLTEDKNVKPASKM